MTFLCNVSLKVSKDEKTNVARNVFILRTENEVDMHVISQLGARALKVDLCKYKS